MLFIQNHPSGLAMFAGAFLVGVGSLDFVEVAERQSDRDV